MKIKSEGHTSWVEVNLNALRHNLAEVRKLVGSAVKIMAVVKADAYGHGLAETAKAFAEADYLGTTTLEEGIELRKAGITIPILVFSPLLPDQMEPALTADLDQTVCDLVLPKELSAAAEKLGKPARIHVKVDTGMGRLGIAPEDCPDFMYRLLGLPAIEVAGIYTHFANAGSNDLVHAREQNARFSALVTHLREREIPTGLAHAANSAAILNMPDSRYDMVRPGTILYGQYPPHTNGGIRLDLKETWCLKTRVVALRKLPAGIKVGYGSEFTTSQDTLAAVLPIGYSDGFTIIPESVARREAQPLRTIAKKMLGVAKAPQVIVREKKASVIGRVSMQMCSVDVTDIPGVQVGDEVIVPARRTTTSSRIARLYIK